MLSIEQIIALSNQGMNAESIKAIDNIVFGNTNPAQLPTPTQQVQQVQPTQQVQQVQPTQQVQQVQPTQPTQQVQQVQQVQPTQQVQQVQPTQPVQQTVSGTNYNVPNPANSANNAGDISMQLLNLINTMQKQNLALATGSAPKQESDIDIGLDILGKGDK